MILFGQTLTRSAYVLYICPFSSFSIRFAAKFTLNVLSEIKGQNTHTHFCLFYWNFLYILSYKLKYWKRKSVSICFLQYQWLKIMASAFLSIVGPKGQPLTETANISVELQFEGFDFYNVWSVNDGWWVFGGFRTIRHWRTTR